MQKSFVEWRNCVRYSECDPQGVVFNAHYLTYFDCTINEAFRDSGEDWLERMHESGCDVQLVKSVVEYRKPLRFDEEICCRARVLRLGNSSVTWSLEIFGPEHKEGDKESDLRASGEIVWVYADLAAGKSRPLPEWLRTRLETLT